jgi:uncharacterized membrane protein
MQAPQGFSLLELMDAAATGVEVLAVAVILLAIVLGTYRFLTHIRDGDPAQYRTYRNHLIKGLLLGLELLVAADIIRTVSVDATMNSVLILGLLVVIRTILSWSLDLEMEGRWPWQDAAADAARQKS